MEQNAFHFYTLHGKILTFIERVKQEISKLPTFYLRRCMLEFFLRILLLVFISFKNSTFANNANYFVLKVTVFLENYHYKKVLFIIYF